MGLVSHAEILELYAAIVSASLGDSRMALLSGLAPGFVQGLEKASKPGDQLLLDLTSINAAGTLGDGSVPLEVFLSNGVALAGVRSQAKLFAQKLERLRARSSSSAVGDHRSGIEERRARLYLEAIDVVARLANSVDPAKETADLARFWQLYKRDLLAVESDEVESLMVNIGDMLKAAQEGQFDADPLLELAYQLASQAKSELRADADRQGAVAVG